MWFLTSWVTRRTKKNMPGFRTDSLRIMAGTIAATRGIQGSGHYFVLLQSLIVNLQSQ